MREASFEPPILLSRDGTSGLPTAIATRGDAVAVLAMLPPCGIHWCGVVACLDTASDMARLRLALATALDRYGFLNPNDVDARGRWRQQRAG